VEGMKFILHTFSKIMMKSITPNYQMKTNHKNKIQLKRKEACSYRRRVIVIKRIISFQVKNMDNLEIPTFLGVGKKSLTMNLSEIKLWILL
jgi:hypothetical protein